MTGNDLRDWRTGRGLTQAELAEAVGVSREMASLWERKHGDTDLKQLLRVNNWRALRRFLRASDARTGG